MRQLRIRHCQLSSERRRCRSGLDDPGKAPLYLPHPRSLGRVILPLLLESTLIPLGLYYVFLHTLGPWGAIGAGAAWFYLSILRRCIRRLGVPRVVALNALNVSVHIVVALLSHSARIYFIEGNASTAVLAVVFLASAVRGTPIVEGVVRDFMPDSATVLEHLRVKRTLRCLTVFWGFVYLSSAAFSIELLVSSPVALYAALKPPISIGLSWGAVLISVVWAKVATGRHFSVRWGNA